MFGPLVHGFEQALQTLGKGHVTLRTAQASGLFEIGLCEAAVRALNFRTALRDFLGGAQTEQQVRQRGACGVVDTLAV